MNIKHIIAAVALMAMPHYAAAQQKDTTIVVGNRQIVVSGTDANTTVTVYGIDQKEMKKVSETRFVDGQDIEQVYVTSPFIPLVAGQEEGPHRQQLPVALLRLQSPGQQRHVAEQW